MSTTTAAPVPGDQHAFTMSHREIMEALWGLLLGMFVAILSSTVVSNALPIIVPDLGGTESGYTWVVVAALLATTISTPIWGKLADLFSKKLLVQIALVHLRPRLRRRRPLAEHGDAHHDAGRCRASAVAV